jgi:hypothetical protein
MPSTHDHSSGSKSFSSPRLATAGTPAETDPLAALIDRQERAAALLLEITDTPEYQAAMAELADQSALAASAIFELERASDAPLTSRSNP